MSADLLPFVDDDFCYLTTTGRVSGRPHTIEIWFALSGRTLYLLSGGRDRADWVKNILRSPAIQVKIRDTTLAGRARQVRDASEDALVRRSLLEKYSPRSRDDLRQWSLDALPIVVEL